MKNQLFIIAILVLLFLTIGCSRRIMDFTLLSSKNVELTKFPTYQRGNSRVEGVDKKLIIIAFPTGQPDGKEAIDKAIESIPGAIALLDGVLTYKWWYIPYIYGEFFYVIEGTPLIDPSLSGNDLFNEIADYSIFLLDKDGEITKSLKVEKEEYYTIREYIIKSPKRMYNNIIND